jgi:hypothetical protein
MKIPALLTIMMLWCHTTATAQNSHRYFADHMLIGFHASRMHDYTDTYWNLYNTEWYWSGRAGLTLRKRTYVGLLATMVRARNFESDWKSFYLAGFWIRRYFMRPVVAQSKRRLGLFAETGVLLSNYAFSYNNSSTYYKSQNGQVYLPLVVGAEWRLIEHLTIEGGLRLHYNIGKSWDLHGFGYFSLGLNWHFL